MDGAGWWMVDGFQKGSPIFFKIFRNEVWIKKIYFILENLRKTFFTRSKQVSRDRVRSSESRKSQKIRQEGPGRDPAVKKSELKSLLEALMQPSKKKEVAQETRTDVEREIRRREFVAAASKLQDDDSWKKTVMANLDISS